ncbi:MAG: insulinase family protein [Clostridia bacterium]|nr:insulinase family protein [Clostridia bacterium]
MDLKLKKSKTKKIYAFKNGATIIYQKDKRADYSSVQAGFICGTNKNTQNGLAHFCEHMMFNGTNKRSKEQIDEDNEKLCFMNAATGLNVLYVKFHRCNRKLEQAFEFASDLLLSSKFSKEMVDKERGIIKEEYLKSSDKEKHSVVFYHNGQQFNTKTDAKHSLGSPEDIDKITIKALNKYKKDNFVANNFVLSYCGNLSLGKVKKLAKEYFINNLAEKQNYQIDVCMYNITKKPSMLTVQNDDKGVQVMLSFPFNKTESEMEYDYNAHFLTQFMMRNKNQYYNWLRNGGLVYTASTYPVSFEKQSIFVFSLKTSPEKIEDCFRVINKSITEISKNFLSKEDVETIRANVLDNKDESVSTKTKNDKAHGNLNTYIRKNEFKFMPWRNEQKIIKNITPESINAFAKEIFKANNKPYITILGNTSATKMPTYAKACKILLNGLD